MSRLIRKSHNVSILLYHAVFPAKYRRVVFDDAVESVLREVCIEISLRYEIEFIEIGTDGDHVHLLLQSVPTYSPTKIITLLKSLIARQVFARCPHVKKQLWNSEFFSDGYFVSTVGPQGNEHTIADYVREQGYETGIKRSYQQLYREKVHVTPVPPDADQLALF